MITAERVTAPTLPENRRGRLIAHACRGAFCACGNEAAVWFARVPEPPTYLCWRCLREASAEWQEAAQALLGQRSMVLEAATERLAMEWGDSTERR